jgi:hypothetical protein
MSGGFFMLAMACVDVLISMILRSITVLKMKNHLLVLHGVVLLSLISACSPSPTESPQQTDKSAVATMPALAAPAQDASSTEKTPAGANPAQTLDLSPGQLPGAGVAQPGLMPGHVTKSPK